MKRIISLPITIFGLGPILFYRFCADRSGNFAVFTALLALPLIIAAGAAIDLSRQHDARVNIQALADFAALSMAISTEQCKTRSRAIGNRSIGANLTERTLPAVGVDNLQVDEEEIDLQLSGTIEVALVLDNTYSMIGPETIGEKIAWLKAFASSLVEKLLNVGKGVIRSALVPYAD